MKIERYNEWAVNEGLFDSFKNAMSRVVGGAISKLDSLIKKYKANEDNYWSHYISAQNMLTKAKALQYGVSNQLEHSKYTEEKNSRFKKERIRFQEKIWRYNKLGYCCINNSIP